MKRIKIKLKFHLFFILTIIFMIIVFICIGGAIYYISLGYNGKIILSDWPITFTENFSEQIEFIDGIPKIKDTGVANLGKYNLWAQIIDKNGDEVTSINKPSDALSHYSPMDMVQLNKNGVSNNYTMFAKGLENGGEKWTYIICFPIKISMVTMYFNYDKFHGGKTILQGLIIIILLLIVISGAIYSVWITRKMSNITASIKKIALRTYENTVDKGTFMEVFDSLNFLNHELKVSYEERKRNDTLREEWIANITHDIKTPLSPIKGYAELITDTGYEKTTKEFVAYGEIILKNAAYAEALIDDLKITYQLKNGIIPIKKNEDNIIRFLKELVIDILNNPGYEDRKIIFNCEQKVINFNFDNILLKRAFNNLLYNAIIHNPKETEIIVSLIVVDNTLNINIKDNGRGMNEDELAKLFQRYYRGTNTEENINGTGLGMAIAKQIIEVHGGSIYVDSKPEIGTSLLIIFDMKN